MDNKQALAESITSHVLHILDIQEQIHSCDRDIQKLRDQQSDCEKQRRDLESQFQELSDVLQYALQNSEDPTQAILTMNRSDISEFLESSKTKRSQSKLSEQLSLLHTMLDPDTQSTWLTRHTFK